MAYNKQVFIIYGPTGVGKSDFALELARKISGEIINADVGQFYTPLSIGTAKPDWKISDVPHHLFDVIDGPRDFTVTEYRAEVISIIERIRYRGNVPIIVGGSGFSINALFFPPEQAITSNLSIDDGRSLQELWQELNKIDSERAKAIHPRDTYRIKRALAIWHATGKKPSVLKPNYDPIAPFQLIFLMRDRQELYHRINERVKLMIDQGWIEEVKELIGANWESFLKRKKLIGYDDIMNYLALMPADNKKTLIEEIAKKTRNSAKRQLIYWRMLKKKLRPFIKKDPQSSLETVNLTNTDSLMFIKKVAENRKREIKS
jgi:tRNA dimethylallyltransferase